MMNLLKKLAACGLSLTMILSLAACGKQGNADMTKSDAEPKDAQEAAAMYKTLMDQENAILMENQSLWEKVFLSADKGMTLQELQKVFVEQGCKVAYNLDGGGSATMVMGGERVNKTSGSRERNVSDIVYFTK